MTAITANGKIGFLLGKALVGLCALAIYVLLSDERIVGLTMEQQQQKQSHRIASTTTILEEKEEGRNATKERTGNNHITPPESQAISTTPPEPPKENMKKQTTVDSSHPLFVLALPNHLELALPRYFECGNITKESGRLRRQWTTLPGEGDIKYHQEIGRLMLWNLNKGRKDDIFHGCCDDAEVLMDLQLLAPVHKKVWKGECFDPVLYPGALEALQQSYPEGATILNVVRDPVEWVRSLSEHYPRFWNSWCNPTHNNTFPSSDDIGNPRAYVQFYRKYQRTLQSFARANPHWNYIEIDMDKDKKEGKEENSAVYLEQQLGIKSQCWMDSTRGSINHLTPADPKIHGFLQDQPRPNSVGWPMLVTAMPKAGTSTTHDYFKCGMGRWVGSHQWTGTTVGPWYNMSQIGACMTRNIDSDTYPLLEGCGNSLVWSDIGVLHSDAGGCFYPQLHRNGLERFYKSYPYGTLLNVVRGTSSWVDSAFRHRRLPLRWIRSKCEAMPASGADATTEEWEEWYDDVQNTIRQFARNHPTMTYIEVPLNHQAGDILHDIFRFPRQCWGHSNVNKIKPAANSTSPAGTTPKTTTK